MIAGCPCFVLCSLFVVCCSISLKACHLCLSGGCYWLCVVCWLVVCSLLLFMRCVLFVACRSFCFVV